MIRIDDKTAEAMIKFVIGLHRIRHPDLYAMNGQVGLPDWFPLVLNGWTTECDMAKGFCSCGASHFIGEERNIYVREKE